MTHTPDGRPDGHRPPRDDVDARIGAWLDGELDELEEQRFEQALTDDEHLAERVEALRSVRERLAGGDPEAVPAAFGARVAAAVASETTRQRLDQPADLAAARERRRRRARTAAWVGAAALVLAVALVVPQLAPIAEDLEVADQPVAEELEPEIAEPDLDDEAEQEAVEEPEVEAPPDDVEEDPPGDLHVFAVGDVAVVDEGRAFEDMDALAADATAREDGWGLLGLPPEEAEEAATAAARELAEAGNWDDGTPVDACLADVTDAGGGAAVPVRVERLQLADETVVAHVVAVGSPGQPLDRVRLDVRAPADDCRSRGGATVLDDR